MWGRKIPIAIGCVIMIAGAIVSTFAKTGRRIWLAVLFSDLATVLRRCVRLFSSLRSATHNTVLPLQLFTTVCGILVQYLLLGWPGELHRPTTNGLGGRLPFFKGYLQLSSSPSSSGYQKAHVRVEILTLLAEC